MLQRFPTKRYQTILSTIRISEETKLTDAEEVGTLASKMGELCGGW